MFVLMERKLGVARSFAWKVLSEAADSHRERRGVSQHDLDTSVLHARSDLPGFPLAVAADVRGVWKPPAVYR